MLDVFLPFILTRTPSIPSRTLGTIATFASPAPIPFNFVRRSLSTPLLQMVVKSYHATVSRLASFCSDPNIALFTALSRFLGNLRLFGRDVADIISEIAVLCYFPMKTLKEPPSDIDTLLYAYSNTRPTINQLRPYQLRTYRLVPIIPWPPSKPFNRI